MNKASAQTDSLKAYSEEDTVQVVEPPVVPNPVFTDSTFINHSPRKAAIRSAILPGWGQAYNKRHWKIPIIYGALGTTGAIFVFNLKTYRELRFAYKARIEAAAPLFDSTNYNTLAEFYKIVDANAIVTYRNEYRRNIDFSILFFILFWGLNVVDATVDAHFRTFDVSPDLGFRFKPGYSEMANTTGVSFILVFK